MAREERKVLQRLARAVERGRDDRVQSGVLLAREVVLLEALGEDGLDGVEVARAQVRAQAALADLAAAALLRRAAAPLKSAQRAQEGGWGQKVRWVPAS